MAKLVGCWEYYKGFDGGYTQIILNLGADRSYTRSYVSSAANVDVGTGLEGSSASGLAKSNGVWAVFSGELTLAPEGSDVLSYEIRAKGGALYLGSTQYLPCSK